MALWVRFSSFPIGAPMTQRPPSHRRCFASGRVIRCGAANGRVLQEEKTIVRRSGNYQPPLWNDDFIQLLGSDYVGGTYARRLEELKEGVRELLREEAKNDTDRLEIIDVLQRLGIAYHFEQEISEAMKNIFNENYCNKNINKEMRRTKNDNLYATSFEFRLLRQHGYLVPQEVFGRLKDDEGNFKACLSEDLKGILHLYEASHFLVEGENMLEEARDFTTKKLQEYVKNCKSSDEYLSKMVSHALELPLNWRVKRVEAYWFIKLCQENKLHNIKPEFLELAKLDFNIVQPIHQDDLKYSSRWWRESRLGKKLNFARDRIMENFLWTIGVTFEPQFGDSRRMATKVNALITTIDDIYDVYGTLDELELFTNIVVRWNINELDQLPEYMQICFLSLYNTINSLSYDILIDKGFNVIPYLKKAWADLCKSYLLEAKWYHNGYTPSFEEYMDNAWVSVSGPVMLIHSYIWVTSPITEEGFQCFEDHYPNIVRWSATVLRLADDLGTSSEEIKRGDVSKSIQCYMHETGASEEEARDYIRSLIFETWKKLNQEHASSNSSTLFSKTFKEGCLNLARMAQCMYQYGDGHGVQENTKTKDYVTTLLVHPIN